MISKETKYTVSCSRCLHDIETIKTDYDPPLPEVYQNINVRDDGDNKDGNIYLNFQYKRNGKYTSDAKTSTLCTKCKIIMARLVLADLKQSLLEEKK